MAQPDALARLARVVALRQAGRTLPADLDAWLTDALTAVYRGADPREVFGLKAKPGQRSPVTREQYRQRDRPLAAVFSLATGADHKRGETVLEWWGLYRAGRLQRQDVAAHLAEVAAAGLPMPTDAWSIVRRVARARELTP